MKNGYRSGQFEVKRSGPKWCVEEHGSDGLPRTVDIGSYWAWKRAAKAAEIMRRIYCDGQDWDGNGPPGPESDESLIEAWKAGGGSVSDDGRAAAWLAELPAVLRDVISHFKPQN